MGVPVLTIYNTIPEFYWLTNFLETFLSNQLWKPMTSATIAYTFKKKLVKWATKTNSEGLPGVAFQGHDFSMRGMDSIGATISSGLGHATSFLGSDSLPVVSGARKYYGETGFVVGSVPATEHSVMSAGGKEDEIETFRRLMRIFPKGILSIVSDTWNLWEVLTNYLPQLKEEILARDGKLVIRPDSGDPVDILCGKLIPSFDSIILAEKHFRNNVNGNLLFRVEGNLRKVILHHGDEFISQLLIEQPSDKGVIELLWDAFGGTVSKEGYKVLDPHIGAIYGDGITIERAEEICKRLAAKGFASTNVVFGLGSYTYQYNSRDTLGFAMKATYCEVNGEGREIFKDPVTDDGTKKSAKGLLHVYKDMERVGTPYALKDQATWKEEEEGELKVIYQNGLIYSYTTLTEIRERLDNTL